uniref:Adenylate/guanylate cyclase n=1 Tax=uncultured marine thaumarchaeote AD1000_26_G12 TaxID=1455904 RepID=A0A075FNC7_9ARCH|nr:adenylate/guanylate cyclase [uncultured marine thaumarchaeote AD1000_26_G12]
MLGKSSELTQDSETMILETQKRIWRAIKQGGVEYYGIISESDEFLREHVNEKIPMAVMFVDLVGSTDMSLSLPEEKVAMIVSSFAQEMAIAVKQHHGYALKFVGDAVIGYFIHKSALMASDNAISCAQTMIKIIEDGINPILNNYDYPDLFIKIGVDYGESMVMRYGNDKARSHVDLLGPVMNIAAKVQNKAKPQQIMIGEDIFNKIHPTTQKNFELKVWNENEWNYRNRQTGKLYPVYGSKTKL